jgi:anti-anti-sigma factor
VSVRTFAISAAVGDGAVTLILAGEADLAVAGDIAELGVNTLARPNLTSLVLDLAAVTFMDSAAVGALLGLNNVANYSGKQLFLTQVPPLVKKLLEVGGLTATFQLK